MLCHPLLEKHVICMALLLFSMNYPQLPKLIQKLNSGEEEGISSLPELTSDIFIFLTSILMWQTILLPVSSDVNRALGRKPPNKSQKHPPYFWSKCYVIVYINLLCSLREELVTSRPHCQESLTY